MTLTQAEREAVETVKRRAAQIKAEASASLPTPLEIVAGIIDRLLSSRAEPMETVGWATADRVLTCSDVQKQRSVTLFGEMSEPLVLRSAAEAYMEGLRGALDMALKSAQRFGDGILEARIRALTTTEPKGNA